MRPSAALEARAGHAWSSYRSPETADFAVGIQRSCGRWRRGWYAACWWQMRTRIAHPPRVTQPFCIVPSDDVRFAACASGAESRRYADRPDRPAYRTGSRVSCPVRSGAGRGRDPASPSAFDLLPRSRTNCYTFISYHLHDPAAAHLARNARASPVSMPCPRVSYSLRVGGGPLSCLCRRRELSCVTRTTPSPNTFNTTQTESHPPFVLKRCPRVPLSCCA